MPSHPLEGCRAKIRRAKFHIDELVAVIRSPIITAPYRARGEPDPSGREFVIVAEANPDFSGIPLELPLIAGEVAHQLRSALDHLVWQLIVSNTGANPKGTRSGFPIFRTEAGFKKRAAEMITGVSASAEKRIGAAQPYHAGGDAERVLTWILHELNNADKHRLIPVAIEHTSVIHVHVHKPDGSIIEVLPRLEELREALHDGAEIARVTVADMEDGATLDVPFGFDVAFEQVGSLQRQSATQLLAEIADYVGRLIESFGDDFP
jgi:hypothetical protein